MTDKELTAEACLIELREKLRELFPVLTVSVNVCAAWMPEHRDKDFATIRMFEATPHTREFNAPSLEECMVQVRLWLEDQRFDEVIRICKERAASRNVSND